MTHSMTTYLPSQLTLSTHPVNTPCQCATVFRELGDSLNVNIPTLSSYLINTPYQYTLSTHPINTPCQCATVFRELGDSLNDNIPTLSSYLINTPNQHTLSIHPVNTPCQHTLSTHPINTHPINTPCQCATVFRELGDSLNINIPTFSSYLINTPYEHILSTPPLILLLAYNTLYRYQKTLPYPPPCTNPLYQNPN